MRGSRRITILSVTAALLTVAALMLTFALSGLMREGPEPIELPSPDGNADELVGNIPDPLVTFEQYKPVEPGPGGAREMVATLQRPERYSAKLHAQWYWDGGVKTRFFGVVVSDEYLRAEEYTSAGQVLSTALCDGSRLLYWTQNSNTVYEGRRGDATADTLSSVPSYEDLLTLPAESFTDVGYQESEQGRFFVVMTYEGLYDGRYLISLDDGILYRAEFFDAGTETLAYAMSVTELSREEPSDSAFALPDGSYIWDAPMGLFAGIGE